VLPKKAVAALLLTTSMLGSMASTSAGALSSKVHRADGSSAVGDVADAAVGADSFADSVSISGNTIVVGDDSDPNGGGSAYVFSRHGLKWRPAGKVSGASDFGFNVVASGPNFAVGTLYGPAYAYGRDEQGWHRTAVLQSPDGDELYFGDPVALSGATLVAGEATKDSNAGRVVVFTKGTTGWKETAELSGSDTVPGDQFGSPIAVSGASVVVGSGHGRGRVYVFIDGPNGWAQSAELGGQDTRGDNNFGFSVAISGNTIVVGTPSDAKKRGRVYVYTKTATRWRQTAELQGLHTIAGDEFGWAVGISGSTIVVGAAQSEGLRGTAYVFTERAGRWRQIAELNPSNTVANSDFGSSVAISGTTIVVGTAGATSCSLRVGGGPSRPVPCVPPWKSGAYVYSKTVSGWHEVTVLHRPSK
jgi:hypothetical protein